MNSEDWFGDDDFRPKPKTIPELMLRDTPFGEILHNDYPKTLTDLILLLDALDYVVEEWLESMRRWSAMQPINKEGCSQDASDVLMAVVGCRWSVMQFLGNDSTSEDYSFIDVLKDIKELKQSFIKLAKPYLDTPPLGNWYLDLPLMVQYSFRHLHEQKINAKKFHDYSKHNFDDRGIRK